MWFLHSVIVHKEYKTLKEAREIKKEFIKKGLRSYYKLRNDNLSYRFSLDKNLFKTFRSKKINDYITLIYGILK